MGASEKSQAAYHPHDGPTRQAFPQDDDEPVGEVPPEVESLRAQVADERAGRQIAGGAADRFRDVLSDCLGHPDENPGDDVLIREVREHFGKTGPEPTRWRDFCAGALAQVDQTLAALLDPGAPS